MAIALTGTGGLFARIGVAGVGIREANLYLGSTDISAGGLKSTGVRANNIFAQYASTLQKETDTLYSALASVRTALGGWKSYLQAQATQAIADQVIADVPLKDSQAVTVWTEIIRQMVGGGTVYAPDNDIKYNVVSASVAANVGTGTGVAVASVKRPDARNNEYVLAETIKILCTSDEGLGATARSEPFTVTGTDTQADQLAYNWPLGSGGSASVVATDTDLDAQSGPAGQLLTNGNFTLFTVTANVPDDWQVIVGAAGTDILQESSTVYRTGSAVEFVGTGGSPLSSIAQTFDTTGTGTSAALLPNTRYAINFFARKSASLAAGVLKVDLVDSTNTVITDPSGANLSYTVAHGTLTTSYAAYNTVFVTPAKLPTSYKLRLSISTALTSGESVFVDDLAMTEMTEVYAGGPLVAVFAGATNFLKNDSINVTIANDYGGQFQTYCQRMFDLRSMGLQIPSDSGGTQTIAETLFTGA